MTQVAANRRTNERLQEIRERMVQLVTCNNRSGLLIDSDRIAKDADIFVRYITTGKLKRTSK